MSFEGLNKLDKKLKNRINKELKNCNKNDKRYKAKNYKEYIDSFVGPTLRKMFFEKYPKKIWGLDTKFMTPDWAPNRIKFRDKILPFYHEEYAAVGKYGTGCIYDRIASFIKKKGGRFKFGENITGFKTKEKKILNILTSKKNYNISDNDIIISSLPINITSKYLGKNNKLKYRGICSVYLFYNKNEILPKNQHWLYFDSDKVLFNRITENKKLSKYVAPKDKSFLTAEITYSAGDNFSKNKPQEVIKKVKKQIETTNLISSKHLMGTNINYEPYVYPVQFADYKNEVAKVKSFVESFQNLFSVGAGGEFNYADSQILFHKSFDLVNSLIDKYKSFSNETKNINLSNLNSEVIINQKKIGAGNKTFIIAEAGINHNGVSKLQKN